MPNFDERIERLRLSMETFQREIWLYQALTLLVASLSLEPEETEDYVKRVKTYLDELYEELGEELSDG